MNRTDLCILFRFLEHLCSSHGCHTIIRVRVRTWREVQLRDPVQLDLGQLFGWFSSYNWNGIVEKESHRTTARSCSR